MSVQLPPESFAETRACLEARARTVPSDGETPWDQRLCDAFVEHHPLVRTGAGEPAPARRPARTSSSSTFPSAPWSMSRESALAGELERDGLISTETVRRDRL